MSDPLFDFTDQVVLVSGGSRGIGQAIAFGFAARGARVIVTGREEATITETAKGIDRTIVGGAGVVSETQAVIPMVCDVADETALTRLVERVYDKHERIDTLINVAGVNKRQRTEQFTSDDYDFIVNINLRGAFLLSKLVGERQLARGAGCQINIDSLNSDRPLKAVTPYAISKAGMNAMTRALALEWGDRGVRVNGLAPGFILTDLTEKLWSDPTMNAWGTENTPMRRLGRPADMIGTALFLASDAAAFLTGQTIYVDGGFTSGVSWPIPLNG